jgi:uncharacterized repeat protein (TIGR03843 family)
MPWSSNGTYLVQLDGSVRIDGSPDRAIYKPRSGERPLWDFPPGLDRRETAAFELSEALGWGIVPPTVLRDEAPLGPGSVQSFVEHDPEQHHFTLVEDERFHDQLRSIAVFDLLANNTDRKSGHCLLDRDGHVFGIDHGLCFSAEFKLRTVIWEFGGEPIADELLEDVQRVITDVPVELCDLLSATELDALTQRGRWIVRNAELPTDDRGHRYPWPLV